MNYRGFEIKPVYSLCADWKLDQHNRIVPRNPKPSDIEYYEVLDPMEGHRRQMAESTITQCKQEIDKLLDKLGMKDNTAKSWESLNAN